jgi:hypothetical protein
MSAFGFPPSADQADVPNTFSQQAADTNNEVETND